MTDNLYDLVDAFDKPLPQPVDLHALMSSDPPEQEWFVEPLLLARKHTGIISSRGDGKSLLLQDVSARRAVGHAVLDQPAGSPAHIVYIDMEMGPDDLWDRFHDLGWTTDHPDFDTLAAHLHYYQLIDLPRLDTVEGGDALENIVEKHRAELVVIDTVSRVVGGDENTAEPYKELFLNTEIRLKRRGVALARLDHLGKDKTKGSRGTTAKEDPLDVIFQLETTNNGLRLKKTKGRQPGIPDYINITQEYDNGVLRHVTPEELAAQWLIDLVFQIDQLGLPDDAGTPTIQKALQATGNGRRRTAIVAAVKFRKGRNQGVPKSVPTPGTPPREHLVEHPGTPPNKSGSDQGQHDGNTSRNTSEHPIGVGSPPIKGNTPGPNRSEVTQEPLPEAFDQ